MNGFEDLTGHRFGRLLVLGRAPSTKRVKWNCQCDCGNKTTVETCSLKSGTTKSCGCLRREMARQKAKEHITHGFARTRLYYIWADMKRRCYAKEREGYKDYGGRGIRVCDEWKNDFTIFKDWAFENGYNDELTIDRIDVNGNYEPSNCRWATWKEQANNKRNKTAIEFDGETHSLKEWSEITGIGASTIQKRLSKRGWSVEDALMIKDGRKARLWV